MKILVLGSGGTLGQSFHALKGNTEHTFVLASRADADVEQIDEVRALFRAHQPDAAVNLAAKTNLDALEDTPQEAFASNTFGAWNIAIAAQEHGAMLVHISTLGLYSEAGHDGPYTEMDAPAPGNVYARSKLAAEQYVQQACHESYIVRTTWLFGGGARDTKFVGQISARLRKGEPVKAVTDQRGSLTYARDLVDVLLQLLPTRAFGTYHITNAGTASRYEIAEEMIRILGSKSELSAGTMAEFDLRAKRPTSEMTELYALEARGLSMRSWQDALREYLDSELN